MRTARNYYEILGMPRDATLAQIKRRYRQLVRKYHPDVASDKQVGHRLFLQIREAYEALSDPIRRRDYDVSLDEMNRRAAAASRPPPPRTSGGRTATIAQHLKDAQWAFIQKRFHESAVHCKEVLRLDPQIARAHAIMGDIFRAQGKNNSAIRAYSYAMQFDPSDRDSEKKLMKLLGKQLHVKHEPRIRSSDAAARVSMAAIWWSIAFFLILLISVHPGTPIPWLAIYVPQISKWSWNLVGLMALASGVVGAMLSLSGQLSNPDEEVIFESGGANWAVIPAGIILLVGSGFFFIGAAALYLVIGLLQGSLSKSVLTSFVAVVIVVGLSALMYVPDARSQVLLFGGNVAFLSMLFGWYAGSTFKPLSAV